MMAGMREVLASESGICLLLLALRLLNHCMFLLSNLIAWFELGPEDGSE